MKFYKIDTNSDFNELCKIISPSKAGQVIMHKKSKLNFFFIKDISAPAANILKQDALSVGAELVTNKNVILNQNSSNALLIATDAQTQRLAKKESAQDFGLKELAKFLNSNFKKSQSVKIMGVLNFNNDSFNPDSRVSDFGGVSRIEAMIKDGADYIDIGAVSSRPGSVYVGRDEEFKRLKFIIDEIYRLNLYKRVKFSLDSFDEYCIKYALDRGFKMINDISANLNLAPLAARYDSELCIMHMQNDPKTMQIAPKYDDLLGEISAFFKEKIAAVSALGAKKLILDVGIGFGKTAKQNLLLIKNLEHFTRLGYPLLVGASRKSVIDFYSPSEVSHRLAGSLFLHLRAHENGAKIIRTHDVSEHVQMFKLFKALKSANLE